MAEQKLPADLPDHLASTYRLIRRAYPAGIPDEAYWPVLGLLAEEMSFRSVATVIPFLTDRDYALVYNDVLRVLSTDVPAAEDLERVREHLRSCGYEEWLAEPA